MNKQSQIQRIINIIFTQIILCVTEPLLIRPQVLHHRKAKITKLIYYCFQVKESLPKEGERQVHFFL